jgi:hypothetical protein
MAYLQPTWPGPVILLKRQIPAAFYSFANVQGRGSLDEAKLYQKGDHSQLAEHDIFHPGKVITAEYRRARRRKCGRREQKIRPMA